MIKMNRNLYRSFVIVSFLGVVIAILFIISQTLAYLNTGADRSSMLHVALNKEKVYLPKLVWKDTINPGRPIEKQTMNDIQTDYLNAWYVRNVAYQNNELKAIDDYYTTSAMQNIVSMIEANQSNQISIHGTTITHNLSLDFYSADGQLAVISDSGVEEYQHIYQENQLLFQVKEISNYKVLLLLEDGYWRIRHMVKEKSNHQENQQSSNGFAKVIRYKIYVDDKEYQMKGINYYPQKTPWDMFGDDFDIEVIGKDFDILKEAGLNTIRIFIPYEEFGKEQLDTEKLEKLEKVLNMAQTKGLMVVPTLFDFYGDYSVLDWTLTHRHAEQIVGRFKDHKAILAWDVKNEPNLDFESRGKENVTGWLKEMIHQIKEHDPNHLVTIGWSDMESATLLNEEVDIVSFHYYKDIDDFDNDFSFLDVKVDKPLVLQEFGLSSNRGLWSPFGFSERNQADYHKTFQEIIKKKNIHYLSWTLYDFQNVPSSVVGRLPWRKHKQKHFGFIDASGNKKEAFQYISH